VGALARPEWVRALEDCRHVCARLERFQLARGEQVVRVPLGRMAGARRGARERGKSDAIDAPAVAPAFLREPARPAACLARAEREIRLVADRREDLVGERMRIQNRLCWHLHDLEAARGPRRGARPIPLPPARAYLERKQADGKSRREAVRCIKRHLARVVYHTLRAMEERKIPRKRRRLAAPALT
jgi:hypothetical protein